MHCCHLFKCDDFGPILTLAEIFCLEFREAHLGSELAAAGNARWTWLARSGTVLLRDTEFDTVLHAVTSSLASEPSPSSSVDTVPHNAVVAA